LISVAQTALRHKEQCIPILGDGVSEERRERYQVLGEERHENYLGSAAGDYKHRGDARSKEQRLYSLLT